MDTSFVCVHIFSGASQPSLLLTLLLGVCVQLSQKAAHPCVLSLDEVGDGHWLNCPVEHLSTTAAPTECISARQEMQNIYISLHSFKVRTAVKLFAFFFSGTTWKEFYFSAWCCPLLQIWQQKKGLRSWRGELCRNQITQKWWLSFNLCQDVWIVIWVFWDLVTSFRLYSIAHGTFHCLLHSACSICSEELVFPPISTTCSYF